MRSAEPEITVSGTASGKRKSIKAVLVLHEDGSTDAYPDDFRDNENQVICMGGCFTFAVSEKGVVFSYNGKIDVPPYEAELLSGLFKRALRNDI